MTTAVPYHHHATFKSVTPTSCPFTLYSPFLNLEKYTLNKDMAGAGRPPSLLALANYKKLQANSYARSTTTFSTPKQCRKRLNASLVKHFSQPHRRLLGLSNRRFNACILSLIKLKIDYYIFYIIRVAPQPYRAISVLLYISHQI